MPNFLKFFRSLLFSKPLPETYDLSICCIVKDEDQYFQEWIEYHRKIGVKHFFIYDNGSKIPVRDILLNLNLLQYATVKAFPGKAMHVKAYHHCLKNYGTTSRWIAFIDIDEFIVPKTNSGNLPEFLKAYENYGGLGVNWLIFGSNGHLHRTNKPQLQSFTMRSDESFSPNNHIKSIVQPRFVKSAFKSHCFHYIDGKQCVNENFAPIDGATSDISVRKIQLNHYYCRSLEEYREKIERGISDTRKARKLEAFYYHDAESNKVQDITILEVLNKEK